MPNLLDQARSNLLRANADKRHPFRFFTLSTFGKYPEARTVVKRKTREDLATLIYTDTRTPKMQEILANPRVTALFYDARKKLQIRIKGEAEILKETSEEYKFHKSQIMHSPSLKDYSTALAPGSNLEENLIFKEEIYFSAIWIHPIEIDILQLNKEEHKRMRYLLEDGRLVEQRIVP